MFETKLKRVLIELEKSKAIYRQYMNVDKPDFDKCDRQQDVTRSIRATAIALTRDLKALDRFKLLLSED